MKAGISNLGDGASDLEVLVGLLPLLLFHLLLGPREDSFLWVEVHHRILAGLDVRDQRLKGNPIGKKIKNTATTYTKSKEY